ncbi:MAG TPA: hypothetical protein VGP95_08265 [Gemmatimonadaceae bacterium]|jgi:hypothetical protein|nr:hypothetical protein [Gemmatimonadaceae bacterium]
MHLIRRSIAFSAGILSLVVVACSSSRTSAPPADGLLPLGNWGGEGAGMIVSDTAMHLHVGCTFGDASGRIALNSNGQFDVAGSYMLHAFPIAVGPTVPARFTGRLDGNTVTVTATVNDTVQKKTVVMGPVVVVFGAEAKLGPCPICRRTIVTREMATPSSLSLVR